MQGDSDSESNEKFREHLLDSPPKCSTPERVRDGLRHLARRYSPAPSLKDTTEIPYNLTGIVAWRGDESPTHVQKLIRDAMPNATPSEIQAALNQALMLYDGENTKPLGIIKLLVELGAEFKDNPKFVSSLILWSNNISSKLYNVIQFLVTHEQCTQEMKDNALCTAHQKTIQLHAPQFLSLAKFLFTHGAHITPRMFEKQ